MAEVHIEIDGKRHAVNEQTTGFTLLRLARPETISGYYLARELPDRSQAEDISDLHSPLACRDGDSFVTFPGAGYCQRSGSNG